MDELPAAGEPVALDQGQMLQSLLHTSIDLTSTRDRQELLERILSEARRLSGAEAGSLYVRLDDRLEFALAQNDAIDVSEIARTYLGRRLRIDTRSLAGFVAHTGRSLNIPDSHHLAPGTPFRINRDFDAASGYTTGSILALPLTCPDGEVVGVLELINRLDADGNRVPFPDKNAPVLMSLAALAAVNVHNALLTEELMRARLDTIMRLSIAAEFRDKGTGSHIRRMSSLSALIFETLGLARRQVELIRHASPMHDIGKIAVPDSILLKPGKLTPEERKIVETHSVIGAQILGDPKNELMAMARDIALSHHERWDGKGYPHRLSGAKIPLAARAVGLADVFDALASERCYKPAYPMDQVVKIIRSEKGGHFDPRMVKAFFEVSDQFAAAYQGEPAAE